MNVQPFGPGVTLIAGPETMPLPVALAAARASGARVYVIGAEPRDLSPADRADVEVGPLSQAQAWLDAQPGTALVLVFGAVALDGWMAAERVEDRLLRLLDELKLRPGAGLVMVEPLPVDRLVSPDRVLARLLARSDRRDLWTEDGPLRADSVLARRGHPSLPRDAMAHEAWLYVAMLGVALVAIAVALRPTLLGPHQGIRLLGDVGEGLPRHLWLTSWLLDRIKQGGEWIDTQRVYWPVGANVVALFGNIAADFLATPLQALLGFPRYWNFVIVSALLSNGLAMGWLARELGADRTGAMLASLAFCVAPPLLQEVSRAAPEVLWAAPLVVTLGLGLRAARGTGRDAALAGLALGVTSLFWWAYGLLAASVLGLLFVARAVQAPAQRPRLLGAAGTAARFWAPALVAALPALAAANRGRLPDLGELYLPGQSGPSFAATLAFHRMTTDVLPLDQLFAVPSLSTRWVPSALVIGLLAAALIVHRGKRLAWGVVAVLSAVLALGPWLAPSWGMSRGWLPLPLRGLQILFPPLQWLDRPDRLLVVTALSISLLVGLCWHPLSRRLAPARRPAALGASVAAIAMVPMLSGVLPVASFDYSAPRWVQQLTEAGAVIHLPLGWSEASTLWAPLHNHPVAGGPDEVQAMRDPTPYSTAFQQTPALNWFRTLEVSTPSVEVRRELTRLGARYIVVEADFMKRLQASGSGPEYEMLDPLMVRIDTTFGPPIYDEDGVKLYKIDPTP